jgi:hypothetical protein
VNPLENVKALYIFCEVYSGNIKLLPDDLA